MAVPRNALKKWEKAREFALGLPGATEAHAAEPHIDEDRGARRSRRSTHAHALTCPGAEPAGYGLGKAGWVGIPLEQKGAPAAELLCDWVEESYRVIAPKRLTAEEAADGGAGRTLTGR
ncbi:MmcQ/YjbR family DNA-binding protein [Streptomyces cyaneochromogenes]|uniref:MmcQ/YjbR family DNA-binding protein n=1 Tax=Streptomyces cyaneochromogenes TaxID=2496836 RepID=A0A3S9MIA7_9ACTN|nr:MmcQ/YjbR family DNA-binding protein [Streptomyces cyaneochromogenes]AZQ38926.1 MmcQ/YjbR family DNA-binding protein [Streptomyces cyaneochromogenes]